MPQGKFIVIEGSDGSGKSTQFELLYNHLTQQGKEVVRYKFPQYDKPSSYFSVSYLNGNYGDANELGAYKPSLFYALDRFEASYGIRKDLEEGKIVLCDRYVGSNMAHQGQKLHNTRERRAYFDWIYNLEFEILGIPKPDANIVLLMPPQIAHELIAKREKRNYTEKQHDIHEADLNHLERAVKTYEELCKLYPETFTPIHCTQNRVLLSIEDVHKQILVALKTKSH